MYYNQPQQQNPGFNPLFGANPYAAAGNQTAAMYGLLINAINSLSLLMQQQQIPFGQPYQQPMPGQNLYGQASPPQSSFGQPMMMQHPFGNTVPQTPFGQPMPQPQPTFSHIVAANVATIVGHIIGGQKMVVSISDPQCDDPVLLLGKSLLHFVITSTINSQNQQQPSVDDETVQRCVAALFVLGAKVKINQETLTEYGALVDIFDDLLVPNEPESE